MISSRYRSLHMSHVHVFARALLVQEFAVEKLVTSPGLPQQGRSSKGFSVLKPRLAALLAACSNQWPFIARLLSR